jgi:methyl-accepting chemotaxis protein
MNGEKRKDHRQPLKYPAHIAIDGETPRPCALHDISNSGARIGISNPDEIPDRFALLLSANGGTRRQCQVIWRKESQIGVEFLKAPPARAARELPPRLRSTNKDAGSRD